MKSRRKGGQSGTQPSLTRAQILAIRRRDENGHYPESAAHWARILQVTGEHIRRIRRGESYQWAGGLEGVLEEEAERAAPEANPLDQFLVEASLDLLQKQLDQDKDRKPLRQEASKYLLYPEEREDGAVSPDINDAKKVKLDTGEELDLEKMMELPGGVEGADDQSASELEQRSPDDTKSQEQEAQKEREKDQPNKGDHKDAEQPADPEEQQSASPRDGTGGGVEVDPGTAGHPKGRKGPSNR